MTRRNATGPLRRLFWSREAPRPLMRGGFWNYAYPLGLLALTGLGLVAGVNLNDTRDLLYIVIVIMAIGSVLPVVLTLRRPLLAWRLAFVMLFVGSIEAPAKESWPWNVVQILGFLAVLARLAAVEEPALTIWATAASLVPVFLYSPRANAWGAALLLVAIAALGDIVYRRRRLVESRELTELERAKRAVLEERTRIAREMHDVVAHHMSMIAVRAETAPYRLPGLPDPARDELATIAVAAREALTDMRRLLGVLRSDEVPLTPQPGFAQVDDLITTARAAGLDVTADLAAPPALPETVSLAAYRIVQEALANAARHAPGGPVTVMTRAADDHFELTVRNRCTALAAVGAGGHGISGMRERAELLGGTLTATPDGDDFLVHADLPLREATPE